jgi:hypothetical protein
MPSNDDIRVGKIWEDFCDSLKDAKAVLFRGGAPTTDRDLAAGLRMLARNIPIALDKEYENADPLHPEFIHHMDWRHKFGGDNPDALYLWAPINGTDTYRVTGTWGSAAYVAFTVSDRGDTKLGSRPAGHLFGHDMRVDAEGRFELIVSPEPPDPLPANWIQSSPSSFRLMLRQFFGDWEREQLMSVHIDRLGDPVPPPDITLDLVAEGLHRTAQQVNDLTTHWADTIQLWQARPLVFRSFHEVTANRMSAATPGGAPLVCYWEMESDEALIVRVTPPEAKYWNFEFGNWWFETMDYRYRLAGTNSHYAVLEDDGELILVASHDDPGVPNWLDAAGYASGYMICRWMAASSTPTPIVERVKRSALTEHLPNGVRTISPPQRREQLAGRRRGVMRRFSGY